MGGVALFAAACASAASSAIPIAEDASVSVQADAAIVEDALSPEADAGSIDAASVDATTSFIVAANHVLTPAGERLYAKGVAFPYGAFTGDPGLGVANLKTATRELDRIAALQFNLVRVFTYPETSLGYFQSFVKEARARGLIVEITGWHPVFAQNLVWMGLLADLYKDDPYVWLEPANEPNCPGDLCKDWVNWQNEHKAYVSAIRKAGMRSPIVVDTPNFSTDFSGLDSYPLPDPNVVFAVHRYGNDNPTFDEAERSKCEVWATLAKSRAMLIGEFGNYDGPDRLNAIAWTKGFVDYASDWTLHRDGVGANAFTWCWYDGNTMVGYPKGGAPDGGACDGNLTEWGTYFVSHYLTPLADAGH